MLISTAYGPDLVEKGLMLDELMSLKDELESFLWSILMGFEVGVLKASYSESAPAFFEFKSEF